MKKYSTIFMATLFVFSLILTSCEKDKTPARPELPPVDALVMDFSDFEDTQISKKGLNPLEGATYQNFLHGVANVAVWNTVVTVVMAVPTASYIAAFNNDPVYLGDNSWEWEYTVNHGMASYTARLVTSRISNEEFSAEMYITKSGAGAFTDFKWFEGVIRYDRTHAEWTLFESPFNPVALLSIEWNKDWEEGTSDISYTNVKEGDTESGSYISFSISNDPVYDAAYVISHASNTIMIEWNRDTKAGRIKDPVKFGDDMWRCWNTSFEDTDCN